MKKLKKNNLSKPVSQLDTSLDEYEDIQNDEDSDGILDNLTEESEESSEEEVFPIHSDSDSSDDINDHSDIASDDNEEDSENNISDSDIDQPDDDLPDSKAWGKRKRLFYNADHINDKNDYRNEEDEEAAKMEEEEAKIIQKRLISEIDNADLSIDLLSDVIAEKKELDLTEKEKIAIDLSQMNQQEKLKLLKKESPKFLPIIEDYTRLLKVLQNDISPVLEIVKSSKLLNSFAGKFIKMYSQLIMNYCTNITFYLLLKSRRSDCESHPIHGWITRYQHLLRKSEPIYLTQIKPQIELILNGSFEFEKPSQKKKKQKSATTNQADAEMMLSDQSNVDSGVIFNDDNSMSVDDELMADGADENDGKRPITYQIAKNKGLTPHRKKELRNPRVKHRMKYRKAKIRRKGQVREVRKELQKYSGEISGIKATVIKSVKLKN